jgi:hypothetical protein
MKVSRKALWFGGGLLVLVLGWLVLNTSRNTQDVTVKLWDGSTMLLIETDHGHIFCDGGAAWQRTLFKILRVRLPASVHYRPEITKASYTNGIALVFRRDIDIRTPPTDPTHAWNGSGKMFYVSPSGHEVWAWLHGICWDTDIGKPQMIGERLLFEIPFVHEPQLHLRVYETNRITDIVSTNDFWMKNPAL